MGVDGSVRFADAQRSCLRVQGGTLAIAKGCVSATLVFRTKRDHISSLRSELNRAQFTQPQAHACFKANSASQRSCRLGSAKVLDMIDRRRDPLEEDWVSIRGHKYAYSLSIRKEAHWQELSQMLGSFEGASRSGQLYSCGWSQRDTSLGQCAKGGAEKCLSSRRGVHINTRKLAHERLPS